MLWKLFRIASIHQVLYWVPTGVLALLEIRNIFNHISNPSITSKSIGQARHKWHIGRSKKCYWSGNKSFRGLLGFSVGRYQLGFKGMCVCTYVSGLRDVCVCVCVCVYVWQREKHICIRSQQITIYMCMKRKSESRGGSQVREHVIEESQCQYDAGIS